MKSFFKCVVASCLAPSQYSSINNSYTDIAHSSESDHISDHISDHNGCRNGGDHISDHNGCRNGDDHNGCRNGDDCNRVPDWFRDAMPCEVASDPWLFFQTPKKHTALPI